VELLAQAEAEENVEVRAGVAAHWTPPPLDTAALLRRGQDLASDRAAPVVPALCLRAAGYASAFHPDIEVERVKEWAAERYRRWLRELARDEREVVESTLITDPGNLLLGAKALPDPALAAGCIRAQFDLYEREQATLPRLNQTVLGSLLEPDDPQPASGLVSEPLEADVLVASPRPVHFAALGLLSRRTRARTVVPPVMLEALAFRSVWMRDLSGVGLTLLGAALLDLPLPPGLLPWVARVARSDGFFGMWELYADPHPVANLLGTVNLYWGLSAVATEYESSVTAAPLPSEPSRAHVEEAIAQAQQWLDQQQDRFSLLPSCPDEECFESTFKPLVEMALLCHVLTRQRHDGSFWAQWARGTAERLHAHVEWEGLIEAFRLQTSATLGLGIYPLLESVTGRAGRFSAQARELLADPFADAQERTPMREMDYQFTRALIGLPMTLSLPAQLARTLVRKPFDPLLMDTDALYDLTHLAFYATRFGCVPWDSSPEVRSAWPGAQLESMALGRLLMGDADLGSELLMTRLYTGEGRGAFSPTCLRLVLDAQTPDGSFLGPEGRDASSDEFSARYHTTLVAMGALAESLVW